ncbi:MAG: flagellar motor stator protein MotA [Gemmatimonadota bacterium]
MLLIIGFFVVFASIYVGYTMHGGTIAVLIQVSEFIIIGGAGIGALLIGNSLTTVKHIFTDCLALLKADPYGRAANTELLQVLYELFYVARRDGLIGIEEHVEQPETSSLFAKYPTFANNRRAVDFLADTMKVLLTGTVADHHLAEILDLDLEQFEDEAMHVPHAVQVVGDAMPGFGIVAAVLGVIITMGKIGGEPAVIGESVAAALVGTFLGVLLAYAVFGPVAQQLEGRVRSKHDYLRVIRTALLAFARGDAPLTCVEFARRSIAPDVRPSFAEVEALTTTGV